MLGGFKEGTGMAQGTSTGNGQDDVP